MSKACDLWHRLLGQRVRTLMAVRLPWMSKSAQDDHSGTCKKLIKTRFTVVMKEAVVFVVWHFSMAEVAGPEPKDYG